jgi:hypothetical protein
MAAQEQDARAVGGPSKKYGTGQRKESGTQDRRWAMLKLVACTEKMASSKNRSQPDIRTTEPGIAAHISFPIQDAKSRVRIGVSDAGADT